MAAWWLLELSPHNRIPVQEEVERGSLYQGGGALSLKIQPDSPRPSGAGQAVSPHQVGAGSPAEKEWDGGGRRPAASPRRAFQRRRHWAQTAEPRKGSGGSRAREVTAAGVRGQIFLAGALVKPPSGEKKGLPSHSLLLKGLCQ